VLGAWSDGASGAQPEQAVRDLIAYILDRDERIAQVDVAVSTGGVTVRVVQARAALEARLVA
jgi:hypothetical protein